MTMISEAELEKSSGLLKSKAVSFHMGTGIAVDELIGQGNLIMVEAALDYKEESAASFSTYYYSRLHNGLCYFTKEWRKQVPLLTENGELPDVPHPPLVLESLLFKERLRACSKDAQKVVSILLETPEKITKYAKNDSPKIIRGALSFHLQMEGWGTKRIGKAFRELNKMLGERS